MDLRQVVFGFFVVLAATLNFGYFVGPISDPTVHHSGGLIAAVAVNLLTTVLKWGDRTQLGAVHLATSLVADLQPARGTDGPRLRRPRLHRRHDRGDYGGGRVPLRWCAVGEPGLRHHPRRRSGLQTASVGSRPAGLR